MWKKYPPYETLKVSMAGAIAVFSEDGKINLPATFMMLPIKIFENFKPRTKNFSLPLGDERDIVSMNYLGTIRGIQKKDKITFHKNSIMLDITVQGVNVNCKVYSGKGSIQLSGAKSEKHALKTCMYIKDHCLKLQQELTTLKDNIASLEDIQEETKKGSFYRDNISWDKYIYSYKGKHMLVKGVEDISLDELPKIREQAEHIDDEPETKKCTFYVKKNISIQDHYLKPVETSKYPLLAPIINKRIQEFKYWSDFWQEMFWLVDQEYIVTPEYDFESLSLTLYNNPFHLNFNIILAKLAILCPDYGFTTDFDNHLNNIRLMVYYFFDPKEIQVNYKNKYKQRAVTFIVMHTGSVTLTGPGPEKNKEAYDIFMTMIYRHWREISNPLKID